MNKPQDFNIINSKGVISNNKHKSVFSQDFVNLKDREKLETEKMEYEVRQSLINRIRIRMQDAFHKEPKKIDFTPYNQTIVVPAIIIDEFKPNPITKGRDVIKKDDDEMKEEINRKYKSYFPIVAVDSDIQKEKGINPLDKVLLDLTPSNIKKVFFYEGIEFWVLDFFNVMLKVPNESVSLLTKDFPESEIEKQRQIELERIDNASKVQSSEASIPR